MSVLKHIVLTLLLCALCSCSSSIKSPAPVAVTELKPPLSLKIINEQNDSATLRVTAGVTSRAKELKAPVLIRMVGYNGDASVRVIERPIVLPKGTQAQMHPSQVEGVAQSLERGKQIEVPLSISTEGVTHYQVELVWGGDASSAIASKMNKRSISDIAIDSSSEPRLANVKVMPQLKDCPEGSECPLSYIVEGVVENSTAKPLSEVRFGVGFAWVADGEVFDPSMIPQDEDEVKLTGLNLRAGQRKPIRLVLDRSVPPVKGGRYEPVVRISSFDHMK